MLRFRNVFILLVGSLVLFSCQEFVTPANDNTITEKQVKDNADAAEGVMLSAYGNLDGLGSPILAIATDDAVSNEEGNVHRRMATGEWTARFNPVGEWQAAYDAIYQLNLFINDIVNEVDWAVLSDYEQREFKKRLKGEAYGLRALYEFKLLQKHSGLVNQQLRGFPIVESALNNQDDFKIPRSSFQESLNQILADADSAIKYLPDEFNQSGRASLVYGQGFRGRINARAAQGIKSRATLLAASPAYDVIEWEQAAEATAPLLTDIGGPSGLSMSGNEYWLDENDPEIIWRDDYNNNITREESNFPPSKFGNGHVNPSQNLVESFPTEDGYPISHTQASYDANNPYENRDPRLSKYIVYNGMEFAGDTIRTGPNTGDDGLNNTTNSTRTGYYLKKMLDENVSLDPAGGSPTRHFKTHMRYTEFFLNFAEAANEAWGPDGDPNGYGFTARDIIAKTRERAGISQPDDYLSTIAGKEEMRELIRNERRLELCFEGYRFWDLRRWNKDLDQPVRGVSITSNGVEEITVEQRQYQDHMRYGPIPFFEVLKYDELNQNDGW